RDEEGAEHPLDPNHEYRAALEMLWREDLTGLAAGEIHLDMTQTSGVLVKLVYVLSEAVSAEKLINGVRTEIYNEAAYVKSVILGEDLVGELLASENAQALTTFNEIKGLSETEDEISGDVETIVLTKTAREKVLEVTSGEGFELANYIEILNGALDGLIGALNDPANSGAKTAFEHLFGVSVPAQAGELTAEQQEAMLDLLGDTEFDQGLFMEGLEFADSLMGQLRANAVALGYFNEVYGVELGASGNLTAVGENAARDGLVRQTLFGIIGGIIKEVRPTGTTPLTPQQRTQVTARMTQLVADMPNMAVIMGLLNRQTAAMRMTAAADVPIRSFRDRFSYLWGLTLPASGNIYLGMDVAAPAQQASIDKLGKIIGEILHPEKFDDDSPEVAFNSDIFETDVVRQEVILRLLNDDTATLTDAEKNGLSNEEIAAFRSSWLSNWGLSGVYGANDKIHLEIELAEGDAKRLAGYILGAAVHPAGKPARVNGVLERGSETNDYGLAKYVRDQNQIKGLRDVIASDGDYKSALEVLWGITIPAGAVLSLAGDMENESVKLGWILSEAIHPRDGPGNPLAYDQASTVETAKRAHQLLIAANAGETNPFKENLLYIWNLNAAGQWQFDIYISANSDKDKLAKVLSQLANPKDRDGNPLEYNEGKTILSIQRINNLLKFINGERTVGGITGAAYLAKLKILWSADLAGLPATGQIRFDITAPANSSLVKLGYILSEAATAADAEGNDLYANKEEEYVKNTIAGGELWQKIKDQSADAPAEFANVEELNQWLADRDNRMKVFTLKQEALRLAQEVGRTIPPTDEEKETLTLEFIDDVAISSYSPTAALTPLQVAVIVDLASVGSLDAAQLAFVQGLARSYLAAGKTIAQFAGDFELIYKISFFKSSVTDPSGITNETLTADAVKQIHAILGGFKLDGEKSAQAKGFTRDSDEWNTEVNRVITQREEVYPEMLPLAAEFFRTVVEPQANELRLALTLLHDLNFQAGQAHPSVIREGTEITEDQIKGLFELVVFIKTPRNQAIVDGQITIPNDLSQAASGNTKTLNLKMETVAQLIQEIVTEYQIWTDSGLIAKIARIHGIDQLDADNVVHRQVVSNVASTIKRSYRPTLEEAYFDIFYNQKYELPLTLNSLEELKASLDKQIAVLDALAANPNGWQSLVLLLPIDGAGYNGALIAHRQVIADLAALIGAESVKAADLNIPYNNKMPRSNLAQSFTLGPADREISIAVPANQRIQNTGDLVNILVRRAGHLESLNSRWNDIKVLFPVTGPTGYNRSHPLDVQALADMDGGWAKKGLEKQAKGVPGTLEALILQERASFLGLLSKAAGFGNELLPPANSALRSFFQNYQGVEDTTLINVEEVQPDYPFTQKQTKKIFDLAGDSAISGLANLKSSYEARQAAISGFNAEVANRGVQNEFITVYGQTADGRLYDFIHHPIIDGVKRDITSDEKEQFFDMLPLAARLFQDALKPENQQLRADLLAFAGVNIIQGQGRLNDDQIGRLFGLVSTINTLMSQKNGWKLQGLDQSKNWETTDFDKVIPLYLNTGEKGIAQQVVNDPAHRWTSSLLQFTDPLQYFRQEVHNMAELVRSSWGDIAYQAGLSTDPNAPPAYLGTQNPDPQEVSPELRKQIKQHRTAIANQAAFLLGQRAEDDADLAEKGTYYRPIAEKGRYDFKTREEKELDLIKGQENLTPEQRLQQRIAGIRLESFVKQNTAVWTGAQWDEAYREFGYTPEEIAQLKAGQEIGGLSETKLKKRITSEIAAAMQDESWALLAFDVAFVSNLGTLTEKWTGGYQSDVTTGLPTNFVQVWELVKAVRMVQQRRDDKKETVINLQSGNPEKKDLTKAEDLAKGTAEWVNTIVTSFRIQVKIKQAITNWVSAHSGSATEPATEDTFWARIGAFYQGALVSNSAVRGQFIADWAHIVITNKVKLINIKENKEGEEELAKDPLTGDLLDITEEQIVNRNALLGEIIQKIADRNINWREIAEIYGLSKPDVELQGYIAAVWQRGIIQELGTLIEVSQTQRSLIIDGVSKTAYWNLGFNIRSRTVEPEEITEPFTVDGLLGSLFGQIQMSDEVKKLEQAGTSFWDQAYDDMGLSRSQILFLQQDPQEAAKVQRTILAKAIAAQNHDAWKVLYEDKDFMNALWELKKLKWGLSGSAWSANDPSIPAIWETFLIIRMIQQSERSGYITTVNLDPEKTKTVVHIDGTQTIVKIGLGGADFQKTASLIAQEVKEDIERQAALLKLIPAVNGWDQIYKLFGFEAKDIIDIGTSPSSSTQDEVEKIRGQILGELVAVMKMKLDGSTQTLWNYLMSQEHFVENVGKSTDQWTGGYREDASGNPTDFNQMITLAGIVRQIQQAVGGRQYVITETLRTDRDPKIELTEETFAPAQTRYDIYQQKFVKRTDIPSGDVPFWANRIVDIYQARAELRQAVSDLNKGENPITEDQFWGYVFNYYGLPESLVTDAAKAGIKDSIKDQLFSDWAYMAATDMVRIRSSEDGTLAAETHAKDVYGKDTDVTAVDVVQRQVLNGQLLKGLSAPEGKWNDVDWAFNGVNGSAALQGWTAYTLPAEMTLEKAWQQQGVVDELVTLILDSQQGKVHGVSLTPAVLGGTFGKEEAKDSPALTVQDVLARVTTQSGFWQKAWDQIRLFAGQVGVKAAEGAEVDPQQARLTQGEAVFWGQIFGDLLASSAEVNALPADDLRKVKRQVIAEMAAARHQKEAEEISKNAILLKDNFTLRHEEWGVGAGTETQWVDLGTFGANWNLFLMIRSINGSRAPASFVVYTDYRTGVPQKIPVTQPIEMKDIQYQLRAEILVRNTIKNFIVPSNQFRGDIEKFWKTIETYQGIPSGVANKQRVRDQMISDWGRMAWTGKIQIAQLNSDQLGEELPAKNPSDPVNGTNVTQWTSLPAPNAVSLMEGLNPLRLISRAVEGGIILDQGLRTYFNDGTATRSSTVARAYLKDSSNVQKDKSGEAVSLGQYIAAPWQTAVIQEVLDMIEFSQSRKQIPTINLETGELEWGKVKGPITLTKDILPALPGRAMIADKIVAYGLENFWAVAARDINKLKADEPVPSFNIDIVRRLIAEMEVTRMTERWKNATKDQERMGALFERAFAKGKWGLTEANKETEKAKWVLTDDSAKPLAALWELYLTFGKGINIDVFAVDEETGNPIPIGDPVSDAVADKFTELKPEQEAEVDANIIKIKAGIAKWLETNSEADFWKKIYSDLLFRLEDIDPDAGEEVVRDQIITEIAVQRVLKKTEWGQLTSDATLPANLLELNRYRGRWGLTSAQQPDAAVQTSWAAVNPDSLYFPQIWEFFRLGRQLQAADANVRVQPNADWTQWTPAALTTNDEKPTADSLITSTAEEVLLWKEIKALQSGLEISEQQFWDSQLAYYNVPNGNRPTDLTEPKEMTFSGFKDALIGNWAYISHTNKIKAFNPAAGEWDDLQTLAKDPVDKDLDHDITAAELIQKQAWAGALAAQVTADQWTTIAEMQGRTFTAGQMQDWQQNWLNEQAGLLWWSRQVVGGERRIVGIDLVSKDEGKTYQWVPVWQTVDRQLEYSGVVERIGYQIALWERVKGFLEAHPDQVSQIAAQVADDLRLRAAERDALAQGLATETGRKAWLKRIGDIAAAAAKTTGGQ
ncbi:MAG: hypothetical protein HYS56_05750, partial [Candidatus Omnitrophica bacterium]|nr:hypothetical protein [Candidatus Omnitrophota bacterium]